VKVPEKTHTLRERLKGPNQIKQQTEEEQLHLQREKRKMETLKGFFRDDQQVCAYVRAIAVYLTRLNEYASHKRSSAMIEYNVGGVISVVDALMAISEGCDHDKEKLLELLCQSWFIREDGRPKGGKQLSSDEFYNSDYDANATLGIAIAQLLVSLQGDVDSSTALMLKTSSSLLRRYCGYLQTGTEHEAVFEDETGDEHLSLARFFRSLYKLQGAHHNSNVLKSQELRREGNQVFKHGKFGAAIAKYTEAILLDPTNHILYSNRAACYTYLNAIENAISDLEKSIELNENFQPSWARLGYCYLAKGNAVASVKSYVKALDLANQQELLPQFIQKLVESLNYAEQRARSQGVPASELENLTQRIRHIRTRYPPSNSSPRMHRTPTPTLPTDAGTNESNGTQIPFAFPGMFFTGVSDGDAADTQTNFPIFTADNESNAVRQALNYMVNAFNLNTNVQVPVQDGNQQGQAQQQPPQAQPQPSETPGTAGSHDTQPNTSERDEEMAEDPDVSVPPEAPDQQRSQQHPIPQNIQDIFLNSLPNVLRTTVGPIIVQSLNNALNAGSVGQGATYTTVTLSPEQISRNNNTAGTTITIPPRLQGNNQSSPDANTTSAINESSATPSTSNVSESTPSVSASRQGQEEDLHDQMDIELD
jgi:tetratricopeptide (TPR) repeat protein